MHTKHRSKVDNMMYVGKVNIAMTLNGVVVIIVSNGNYNNFNK